MHAFGKYRAVRRVSILPALAAFAAAGVFPLHASGQALTAAEAREIVKRVETQYQGETSHAIAVMKVATDRWTREMTMEMWSSGRDRFLVKILAPKKDAGVASLKVGNEMWNYLPNIDRLVKIPSSMMGERWMGSHLTNDDLVKENQVDVLYDLSMRREGDRADITAVPKPEAPVVWGKLLYTVDTARLVPLSIQYFDEGGALVRTITFEDVRKYTNRWVPLRMIVQPVDKPRERTELVYRELTFDVKFAGDFFSVGSIRRR